MGLSGLRVGEIDIAAALVVAGDGFDPQGAMIGPAKTGNETLRLLRMEA